MKLGLGWIALSCSDYCVEYNVVLCSHFQLLKSHFQML